MNNNKHTDLPIVQESRSKEYLTDYLAKRKNVRIGIGAKLSLFTGTMIAIAILTVSSINIWQQSKILSAGYNREAASSRLYLSSFVLELDNIAQNLIRIEEFRDRVKKQKNALKKYQTRKRIIYQKKVSLFGIKTNLFGMIGKNGVFYRNRDTYYSEYLSNQDIENLEMRTKALLQAPGEPPIRNQKYKELAFLAKKYVQMSNIVQKIKDKLSEKDKEATPDKKRKLEKSLKQATNLMRLRRMRLDKRIISILSNSQRRKIIELGLDIAKFRIQIFPTASIITLEDISEPTLDTRMFDSKSKLNGDIDNPKMQDDLENALLKYTESKELYDKTWDNYLESVTKYVYSFVKGWLTGDDSDSIKYNYNNMNLRVQYSPHFRNPSSSIRTNKLLSIQKKERIEQLNDYLSKDKQICAEIAAITPQIDERINHLKKSRTPIPPFKDTTFNNLYKEYEALIQKRYDNFSEFARNNKETIATDVLDSTGYLRDAALEDMILIHFYNSPALYDEYMNSDKSRERQQKNWEHVRQWIYSGKSETPPVSLKKSYSNGMIGFSRTEAERIMWKLDSTPLLSQKNTDISDIVRKENFAGIVRTIIDDTEGIAAINSNKKQLIITAFLTTCLAIFFSIYLARIITRNIKIVIQSAEDVGQGNLNVEFKQLGRDEFGNLSIALNHMVTGLREREKVKGILGSMVDPVVIGEAMKDLQSLKDGSEKKITSFFSDVAGFSTISEKMTSIELASLLNEYLSAMTNILKEHDGVLDKYIGDAIVAMFNAPIEIENQTLKAVHASFRMIEKMDELQQKWTQENKYIPEARNMQFRIGLNTGSAKVGFMGTDALASYTMMGDTVNLAARLEATAKDYGVIILGSQSVYDEVKESVITRKLDLVRVKGRSEPVMIYEMIADTNLKSVSESITESTQIYEHGLELYLERKWNRAISAFQESENLRGKEDKAVHLLINRIKHYRKSPPPDDWDGVFTREHK